MERMERGVVELRGILASLGDVKTRAIATADAFLEREQANGLAADIAQLARPGIIADNIDLLVRSAGRELESILHVYFPESRAKSEAA